MLKTLKKGMAALMVVIMMLTSIPLQGFVGFELPQWLTLEAEATETADRKVKQVQQEDSEELPESDEVPLGEVVDGVQTVAPEAVNKNSFIEIVDTDEIIEKVMTKVEAIVNTPQTASMEENVDKNGENFVDEENSGTQDDTEVLTDASGTVNETIKWSFAAETRTLTFSGEGEIPSYYPEFYYVGQAIPKEEYASLLAPWENYLTVIEKLVIGDGITSIGDFNFFTVINLKEIDFGEGIKTIGDGCFAYAAEVEVLSFPSSFEKLGEYCFAYCYALKELYFNEGLTFMGDDCFSEGLVNLKKAYIPSTLQQTNLKIQVIGEGEITFNNKKEIGFDVARWIGSGTEEEIEAIEQYMFISLFIIKYSMGFYTDFLPVEDISADIMHFLEIFVEEWNECFDEKLVFDEENYSTILYLLYFGMLNTTAVTQYCADENLIAHVAEDSAMHDVCREKLIKHTVGDSEELCECFTFEGTVSDTISYSVDTDTRTLIISGEGDHPDNGSDSYYAHLNDYVDYVVFSEDSVITDIGSNAFESMDIKEVTIPASVKVVRNKAFNNCRKLEAVNIITENAGIALWPESFAGCYSLKEIYLPEGVYWLSDNAFENSGLEKITIRNNNIQMGDTGVASTIPYSAVIYCYSGSTAEAFANANYRTVKYLDEFTVDMLEFEIGTKEGFEGEVATVIGYTGKAASVEIPAEINGVPVVAIGNQAFYNNKYIETVSMSDSVTEIDYAAFYYTNLESIRLSKNIKTIGNNAFYNNYSSIKNVYASDLESWLKIDFYSGTSNPAYNSENLYFGEELVREVVVPEGTTEIGDYAFYGYKGLTEVSLPSTLKTIGSSAFYNCNSLKNVYATNLESWLGIDFNSGSSNPICYADNLYFGDELTSEIVIPEGTTEIKDYAFYGYKGLTEVSLPSTLESIESYAFAETSLTKVVVPASVTSMYCAFSGCQSLETVVFEEGITAIPDYALDNCTGLKNVTIPSSVERIGYDAFYNCKALENVYASNLETWLGIGFNYGECNPLYYADNLYFGDTLATELVIPEGITEISDYAFFGYKGLTEVGLPSTLETIGRYAFCGTSLTEVTVPASITSMYGAFSGCQSLETVVFEEGITAIPDYALDSCTGLKNVIIPASVKFISNGAFYGCEALENVYASDLETWIGIDFYYEDNNPLYYADNLYFGEELVTELVIPEGITEISDYAFYGYKGLTSVTLSSSIETIGYYAFAECSNIDKVYADTLYDFLSIVFYGSGKSNPMNCGADLCIAGKLFTDLVVTEDTPEIHDYAFSGCTSLESVKIIGGMTVVPGECFSGCTSLESVELNEGIETIKWSAFFNCSSLKEIDIPDTVTEIQSSAFNDCYELADVNIGANVQSIGDYAFCDALKIKSYNLPETLTYIGEGAFWNNANLREINIPDSVIRIEASTFRDCPKLHTVTLPSKLTYIDSYAFSNASSLESIVIPDSVTYLGYDAFSGCTDLVSAELGDGISYIESNLFYNCTSLVSIEIPSQVTEIGYSAFAGCTSLRSAFVDYTVEYISYSAFENCPNLTFYGVPGSYAESYANDKSIPFEIFSTGVVINLNDENGESVTSGYSVNWYDAEGNLIATGMNIKNITPDEAYSYEIILDRNLSYVYQQFEPVSFIATDEIEIKVHDLVKLPAAEFKGIVTDGDGNRLEGVYIEIEQTFGNKYTKTDYCYTDENGGYTYSALQVPTNFIFSKEGYYDRRKSVYSPEGNGMTDVSVSLVKIPENKITLNLSLTSAVSSDGEPTIKELSNFNGLDFEVYNETRGEKVYDFVIQYPYIVLAESEADGRDEITISVTDRNKKMTAEPTTIRLDENRMGSVDIEFLENGKIQADVNFAWGGLAIIFDSYGNRVTKKSLYFGNCISDPLTAGDYTVVFIKNSSYFDGVSKLSHFSELGIKESDYTKKTVTVENGKVVNLGEINIPVFDESKLYYTVADSTGIYTNETNVTAGKYITVKVQYKIDEKHSTSNERLIIEFPEGVEFVDNSLTLDSNRASYAYENGSVNVFANQSSGELRFYCVAIDEGTHDINAFIKFDSSDSTVMQPIGSAEIEATYSKLKIKEETKQETVAVSGTALPNSLVEVYADEELAASVYANAVGSWATEITLKNTHNYTFHDVYAKIISDKINKTVMTDTHSVLYNAGAVEIHTVTMYNTGDNGENVTVFDFINPTSVTPSYRMWPGRFTSFSFVANFGEDDARAKNVVLKVEQQSGKTRRLYMEYDSVKDAWIANTEFRTFDEAPVGVDIDFSYDMPEDFNYFEIDSEKLEKTSQDVAQQLRDSFDNIFDVEIVRETADYLFLKFTAIDNEEIGLGIYMIPMDYSVFNIEYLEEAGYVKCESDNPEILPQHFKASATSERITYCIVDEEYESAYMLYAPLFIEGELGKSESEVPYERLKLTANDETTLKIIEEIYQMEVAAEKVIESCKEIQEEDFIALENMLLQMARNMIEEMIKDAIPAYKQIKAWFDFKKFKETRERCREIYIEELMGLDTEINKLCVDTGEFAIPEDLRAHFHYRISDLRYQDEVYQIAHNEKLEEYYQRYKNSFKVELITAAMSQVAENIGNVMGQFRTNKNSPYVKYLIRGMNGENSPAMRRMVNSIVSRVYSRTEETVLKKIKKFIDLDVNNLIYEAVDQYCVLYNLVRELRIEVQSSYTCKVEEDEEDDDDKNKVKPILDPSGYVYEAVPSNRVEGVKVEAYYYDYPLDKFGMPMEEKEEIFWDASEYDQVNPLYTDINGQYAWDVPPGQWLVKYSKDGYYDTDSRQDIAADEAGYLPVPPPQVEVNTAIISKSAPTVSSVNVYGEGIQLIFSQYMKLATVNGDTVEVVCGGQTVTGTITASNAEYNYEETEQFASIYEFIPDGELSGTVSVTVDNAVNYAGTRMTSAYSTSDNAEVKPESIVVPENVSVEYNSGALVEFSIYPAQAGANKTLTVTSSSPSIVGVVNSTVATDENGKANVMLQGNLPGSGIITVSLDGTDISSTFTANVGNVQVSENKCEKVTANIPTGSVVASETTITLSTATEGAEIYYTLDGTCPCVIDSASRILYTGPITVTEDIFIIAYAVKDGCEDSATAGFVYTIDTTCKHRELKFIAEVPAACTVSGTKAYYECESCSKKFSDADGKTEITDILISAKGHSWKTPTCTTAKTCSVCKVTEGKALGHKEITLKAVTATCTKTGLTEGKKCSACGVITVKQNTVAKKAHTYKNVTTKATLTKNGKVESKCSACGLVKSTTIVYYPKTIKLSKTAYTYNGKVQTPTVTVKDSKGNTLKKDTDYTVKFESGRKATGKYTVTVTFKGKYSGTKKLTYTIAPKVTSKITATQTTSTITLKWNKVTGADGYRVYQYNTKTKKWDSIKTTTATSYKVQKLKAGTTYKFKIKAYKKDDGTIWGNATAAFTTATKPAVTSKITATQTKTTITLKWSKVTGADGYRVYQYNTKTKKWDSIKTLTGTSYKVEKLKAGTSYKFKIKAYKKVNGTILGSNSATFETATKPATPKITKLTATKGKVTFTWSNVAGETGYQVYYSTKKDSGYKKVASYKTNVVKGSKSKLTSGKKYYFKFRAYKKTASGTVYSAWSAVKSVKVK